MKIAIVGAGNIGAALTQKLHVKGHHIVIGTRDANRPNILELLELGPNVTATDVGSAVSISDLIIIAVPLQAIIDTLNSFKDVESKTIIETTNSFGKAIPGYNNATVAIRQITGCLNVARCFNSTGAENIINPDFHNLKIDTFTAGDSLIAKKRAQELASDIGFGNCYDLGGDEGLKHLENLAGAWAALAKTGLGRRCGFKIVS